MKNTFTFRKERAESMRGLTSDERLQFFDRIVLYNLYGVDKEVSPKVEDLFRLIKKPIKKEKEMPQIDFIGEVNKYSELYPSNMLKDFKDYRLERDRNGMARRTHEKFFDVARRIKTRSSKAGIKPTIKQEIVREEKKERTQEEKDNIKKLLGMKKTFINKGK